MTFRLLIFRPPVLLVLLLIRPGTSQEANNVASFDRGGSNLRRTSLTSAHGATNERVLASALTDSSVAGSTTITSLRHLPERDVSAPAYTSFGSSLALSGTGALMAVTAIRSSTVKIYRVLDNKWQVYHTSIGLGVQFQPGLAISTESFTIANGVGSDSVHVSRLNNKTYDQELFRSIRSVVTGKESNGDGFGSSVALSSDGNILAVGAPEARKAGGRVEVFRYNGTSWYPFGSPILGNANSTYRLGKSVSLSASGSILAIGEPGYGKAAPAVGRIKVYRRLNNGWVRFGNDIAGSTAGARTGQTVSMSANGLRLATAELGAKSSKTFLYQYNSTKSMWLPVGSGVSDEPRVASKVVSLSSDGTRVATGSLLQGTLPTTNTTVSVYQVSSRGTWTKIGKSIKGAAVASLSGDGKTLITSIIRGKVATVQTYKVIA